MLYGFKHKVLNLWNAWLLKFHQCAGCYVSQFYEDQDILTSCLADQTLFENCIYVCLQRWKTECIVNWCKKNNKVMYMIICSLKFLSCTVHRVFLMLSTSSEVDYVPAIELTTCDFKLTFFLFLDFGGGNATECRINCLLGCAHVHVYVVCMCVYGVCLQVACVYVVYVWGCVVWDRELRRNNFFLIMNVFTRNVNYKEML
jgi:hypothetical protein